VGIIHSRASKKRDKAEAELLREQAKQLRGSSQSARHADAVEREQEAADLPAWRQPTVRGMLRKLAEGKQQESD
jgi:hypothetical protein